MKFDVATLKKHLDCRQVIAHEIGPPKGRAQTVAYWPCPFHRGRKYSFSAWADGWRCWADCQMSGDVISFIMKWRKLDFIEACRYLGADQTAEPLPVPITPVVAPDEPPTPNWQTAARQIVTQAQAILWSHTGQRALNYLHQRGLQSEIIHHAQLGYVPGQPGQWHTLNGLLVPAGITIPCFGAGHLWQVRVRLAVPRHGHKYAAVKGGKLKGALYGIDEFVPGRPALIVEGEFDRLICYQIAGRQINGLALSSASNTISSRWFGTLLTSPLIWSRLDDDQAGTRCSHRLQALSHAIKSVQVPAPYKDINEFYLGNVTACTAWLQSLQDELCQFAVTTFGATLITE